MSRKSANDEPLIGMRTFKPYPVYQKSDIEWLGQIPTAWNVRRLKMLISEPIADGPHETPEFLPEGIPFLSVDGIQEGELVFEGCRYISEAAHNEYRKKCAPRRNDLLMGKAASTGKIARVKVDYEFSVWSPLALIRPDPVEAESGFLEYALKSAATQAQIDVLCTSNTQKNISMLAIPTLSVCVAPLSQQRTIAAFLDRETAKIDALVAKNERLIELLQEQCEALIARAFTGRAGPGCEARKLRHLLRQVKRPVSVQPNSYYQEIGIRSWGKGIFHKEPLRGALLEEKSVYYIEPGDLVLNIVFAWEGAVAVVSNDEKGMVASHRFPTFRTTLDVNLDYLLGYLQSEHGRSLMEINSPGAAGRNRTIRLGQFLDEEMPLPTLDEQARIIKALRAEELRLDALLAKIIEAVAQLKEFRTALISAAVTGKIDVRSQMSAAP